MKKILLSLTFLTFAFAGFSQDKDAVRQKQINKCKSEFKQKMPDASISEKDISEFCTCNADKLLSKFTAEEIEKMDAIMATGSTSQKQAVSEKITPVIMPCFADLQSKMK